MLKQADLLSLKPSTWWSISNTLIRKRTGFPMFEKRATFNEKALDRLRKNLSFRTCAVWERHWRHSCCKSIAQPWIFNWHLWPPLLGSLRCFILWVGTKRGVQRSGSRTSSGFHYAEYDVLVLPTFWKGEGYPGVIIEAFSVGLPVVATNLPGISEMIDSQSGILVPPHSASTLAKA